MRNYLCILTVMKTHVRCSTKALPLVAVSEWLRLMAPYRRLKGAFKQHRHHCLLKSAFRHLFFISVTSVNQMHNLGNGGSEAEPFYKLRPATDENSIFLHLAPRFMEPSPIASPRTRWLCWCISSTQRKREIDIITSHPPWGMIVSKSCNEDSLRVFKITWH